MAGAVVPRLFRAVDGQVPVGKCRRAGGVRFDAVDAQLMLRARPGVFVAGEMLDWEAPTGGYLLQATFATAVTAAEGIDRYLRS